MQNQSSPELSNLSEASESASRQLEVVGDGPARCCQWTRGRVMIGLLSLTSLFGLGAAAYFAGQASAPEQQPSMSFPLIDASAALSSDQFSMATGSVSEAGEALFVLDHNSGLLTCSTIYPRTFSIGAVFQVNVAEALATGGKGGKYMMVTGMTNFPSSNQTPRAPTVVYVMDSATGNFACYGIPFNRTAVNASRPQQGQLVLLTKGSANPIMDRDDGR